MDINLNLLPPNKKQRTQLLIKFIFSKHLLELTILMSAITAIILIWSWFILLESFINIAANTTTLNAQHLTYNQEIKRVNKIIRDVNDASGNYTTFSPRLLEIFNNLPADIKLTELRLNRVNNTITINGIAKTREDLLAYQEKLARIPWITKPETPISKLFQKENITFEFNTKLKGI